MQRRGIWAFSKTSDCQLQDAIHWQQEYRCASGNNASSAAVAIGRPPRHRTERSGLHNASAGVGRDGGRAAPPRPGWDPDERRGWAGQGTGTAAAAAAATLQGKARCVVSRQRVRALGVHRRAGPGRPTRRCRPPPCTPQGCWPRTCGRGSASWARFRLRGRMQGDLNSG